MRMNRVFWFLLIVLMDKLGVKIKKTGKRKCLPVLIYASGRNHIHTATQLQKTDDTAPIHQRSGNCQNINRQERAIMPIAKNFALRGTAPLFSQFCMIGPK